MTPTIIQQLGHIVGAANVLTQPRALESFSKDQYDFSPVLIKLLSGKRAEAVVVPSTRQELLELIALAVREEIPLTLRGAGSGNYGQAVPLKGGLVVSTHKMNRIMEINTQQQWVRVEPGARLGVIEREARKHGLELRIYPSTWATATVAGFLAGGFAGVGSIQYGTLWDGLLLDAELLPIEENAQPIKLKGNDCFQVLHAYGTTGILSELTMALAPMTAWEESIFSFASFESAVRFAHLVAADPEVFKREVGAYEWPIPTYFKPLIAAGGVEEGMAQVLLEVKDGQSKMIESLASSLGGKLLWHNPNPRYHQSGFALSDFTWNHTTLWAIKADSSITYTQARFDLSRLYEQIVAIKREFGDEVLLHLEFIREQMDKGGPLTVASPVLLRYTTTERIREIHRFFEAMGIQISDPHTYYLDGDARWAGETVLEGVRRYNPKGLLNPGKLRVLETGEQASAGAWFNTVVGQDKSG